MFLQTFDRNSAIASCPVLWHHMSSWAQRSDLWTVVKQWRNFNEFPDHNHVVDNRNILNIFLFGHKMSFFCIIFFLIFIVIQLQLYAFSPHPSTLNWRDNCWRVVFLNISGFISKLQFPLCFSLFCLFLKLQNCSSGLSSKIIIWNIFALVAEIVNTTAITSSMLLMHYLVYKFTKQRSALRALYISWKNTIALF